MGTANAAESVDEQLEKAHEKIEKLEHALAVEQENNGSLLEVYLGHLFEEQIRATDAASFTQRAKGNDTTSLDAVANPWRRANEMLHETVVNEFPKAQQILATIESADIPPQSSHLLLIGLLLKLLASARGSSSGLQSEIIEAAEGLRLSVVGISKSNIQKMLAAANKQWQIHNDI